MADDIQDNEEPHTSIPLNNPPHWSAMRMCGIIAFVSAIVVYVVVQKLARCRRMRIKKKQDAKRKKQLQQQQQQHHHQQPKSLQRSTTTTASTPIELSSGGEADKSENDKPTCGFHKERTRSPPVLSGEEEDYHVEPPSQTSSVTDDLDTSFEESSSTRRKFMDTVYCPTTESQQSYYYYKTEERRRRQQDSFYDCRQRPDNRPSHYFVSNEQLETVTDDEDDNWSGEVAFADLEAFEVGLESTASSIGMYCD